MLPLRRPVNGDDRLYQTEIGVLGVSNLQQKLFFNPTHSESHEPRHAFFALEGSFASPIPYLLAVVFVQHMEAQNHSLYMVEETTFA